MPLIMWQSLMPCTDHCQARDHCTFDHGKLERCQVQAEYLQDIFGVLCRRAHNAGIRNERVITDIGVHLMPLYSQLMRFLIEEYGVRNTFDMDDKGRYHAHPVFREIRAVIKDIFQVSKIVFATHEHQMLGAQDVQPDMDRRLHGTRGYYEAVLSGEKPPRPVMSSLRKPQ